MTGEAIWILMGVRDGAAHLPAQLDSIAAQEGVRWRLVCSDDGSADGTRDLIAAFGRDRPGLVRLVPGPRAGFARNYLSLIAALPEDAGPVALADQDDLWLPAKLARARRSLARVPADRPALYCARRWLWQGGTGLRPSPEPLVRRTGFGNALVENIAPGNTIVLNPAAARLARQAAHLAGAVYAHDWWLYLLISGAGGHIIADPARVLLYRQHGGNAIGAGTGLAGWIARKRAVLRGDYASRIAGNIAAMQRCAGFLTPENRQALARFDTARSAPLWPRLTGLRAAGLYRQDTADAARFWGAAALGRV